MKFNPVICALLTIALVCTVWLLVIVFRDAPVPDEGEWYCEELGLQIGFQGESFIMADSGSKVQCDVVNLEGSSRLTVRCREENSGQWDDLDTVFTGECVQLKKNELHIREYYSDIVYVFTRVP